MAVVRCSCRFLRVSFIELEPFACQHFFYYPTTSSLLKKSYPSNTWRPTQEIKLFRMLLHYIAVGCFPICEQHQQTLKLSFVGWCRSNLVRVSEKGKNFGLKQSTVIKLVVLGVWTEYGDASQRNFNKGICGTKRLQNWDLGLSVSWLWGVFGAHHLVFQ